ncbi:MAG: hypothetical protein J6U58_02775 [Bacteroidaceae bacterium]|nr:hypothetical protein [Bacteroidaceae bacterium]
MKHILLLISVLITTIMSAQENHIVLQKGSGTYFIPTSLRNGNNACLHIYNGKSIDIYDNEIALTNSIDADSISIEYISSTTREREVTGAVCTEIIKGEELTEMYKNAIQSFEDMTRNEKIEAIIRHEENSIGSRSTSKIAILEPQEGITLFYNREYDYNFFAYNYLGEKYPKAGIMLDADEKVFCFNAIYEYTYSEWGEYKNSYKTLSGKGVLLAMYMDTDDNNSVGTAFYITQTLFNQDNEYEYIRPVYTTSNKTVLSEVTTDLETPKTNEGEAFYKELLFGGIEIVDSNGDVINSITFDEDYNIIGDLSSIYNNVIKAGADITILKMGEYRYITFDTTKEEDGKISIYKHFYKIDNIANRIEQVNTPVLISIVPAVPNRNESFQIHVENNANGKIIINTIQGIKQQEEPISAGKNIVNINATNKCGTYIVTQMRNGEISNTKKFFIK